MHRADESWRWKSIFGGRRYAFGDPAQVTFGIAVRMAVMSMLAGG